MIIIKRWIIVVMAALIILATTISIVLVSCKDDGKPEAGQSEVVSGSEVNGETESGSSGSSSYTESEMDELIDWWNSAVIEEETGTPIENN